MLTRRPHSEYNMSEPMLSVSHRDQPQNVTGAIGIIPITTTPERLTASLFKYLTNLKEPLKRFLTHTHIHTTYKPPIQTTHP